ncbi:MAG: site-specific DNA-methyltransferase [Candidatus Wallbacteria bacterium]|nr:site-specific DNA-methyltransferase [Candidatus Wallbacteria bacterium]
MSKESGKYTSWNRRALIKRIEILERECSLSETGTESEDFSGLPELSEACDLSIVTTPGQPENLLIEGENLEALHLLNRDFRGKIDLIYIDPPYNTGRTDFRYLDNFRSGDGDRHGRWISFMRKRLIPARDLLADEGAIFISINEDEFAHLKLLCDEIFGERNYLTTVSVKVRHEKRFLKSDKAFHEVVEYLLLYRKRGFKPWKRRESARMDDYRYKIRELKDNPQLVRFGGKKTAVFGPGEFELVKGDPGAGMLKKINIRGTLKEGNSSGRFYMKYLAGKPGGYLYRVEGIGDDGMGCRYFLTPTDRKNGNYLQGVPQSGESVKEFPCPNFFDFVSEFNRVGQEGGVEFRNGKKPVEFLKKILEIGNCTGKKDAIVLDFFAGSGSTGQAVLELNLSDPGNRRFILCTNNEEDICSQVCYPRLRNVMLGYRDRCRRLHPGLGGNLRYFRIQPAGRGGSEQGKNRLF